MSNFFFNPKPKGKPMKFKLSPQQLAFIEWIKHGEGSAFVEAVAGSGKTTVLLEGCEATTGSVAFVAYNRSIAQEIKAKLTKLGLGNRIRGGTFHSFGFNAWRYVHPKVEVDERKKREILTQRCFKPEDLRKGIEGIVFKLVSLAKQRAIGVMGSADDDSLWYDIVDHFDLAHEIEDERLIPDAVDMAKRVLQEGIELAREVIDYDDMIYMPVVKGIRMWQNDWVFVDEAQDTNPARRALVRKMLKKNGRAAFVGDRHQAIYGFTGADNDAVDQIVRDFKCVQLPLTVTYRCPKAVVTAAQSVVSHIEAHESAPEGKVTTMSVEEFDELMRNKAFTPKDGILCRLTKPLVTTAYQFIKHGIACHVEGRDIGAGLIALVNRYKVASIDTLLSRLETYRERETQKLIAKGRETQAQAVEDRIETIRVMAEGCQSIRELREKITNLFLDSEQERKPTVTLSTVHKAKGREWERVFIINRECMPSPWARQAWQQEQEQNLIYVGYTRAQAELVLVSSAYPAPKKEEWRKLHEIPDSTSAHSPGHVSAGSLV
jgi:superfamily I DNA/RNA helicase